MKTQILLFLNYTSAISLQWIKQWCLPEEMETIFCQFGKRMTKSLVTHFHTKAMCSLVKYLIEQRIYLTNVLGIILLIFEIYVL